MQFKTRSVLGLTAVVAFGLSSAAVATDIEFTGNQSQAWNNAQNWDPQQIPGAGDKAIIPNGETCTVSSSQFADQLDVQSGGTLIIADGGSLGVDGDSGGSTFAGTATIQGGGLLEFITNGQTVTVSGTMNVQTDATDGDGIVEFEDASHTVDVSGTVSVTGEAKFIESAHDVDVESGGLFTIPTGGLATFSGAAHSLTIESGGEMRIPGGTAEFLGVAQTVDINSSGAMNISSDGSAEFRDATHNLDVDGTLDLDDGSVQGQVDIEGDGNIVNEGFMSANEASGTMRFFNTGVETLTLTDSASASLTDTRWRAFGTNSLLQFDVGSTTLLGHIGAANGEVEINDPIETSGNLVVGTQGLVDVNAELCVDDWVFDHAPGQMGCGGSVNTADAPLRYNQFVNNRGTCDSCDDPGSAVSGQCSARTFNSPTEFTCDS